MATFERFILWWVSMSTIVCALFLGFKACSAPRDPHSKVEKQILSKFKAGDVVLHKLNGQRGILIERYTWSGVNQWIVTWSPTKRDIVNEVEITLEK